MHTLLKERRQKAEVDRYEENEATYLGMKISKVIREDPDGIILDSGKYADGVNHIEISHARTLAPKEPLSEAVPSISRSELGKLMWIARIAQPGAIYDASASAQKFTDGELTDVVKKGEEFSENGWKEVSEGEKQEDFRRMADFAKFMGERQKDVNKVNLFKKNKEIDTSKTHFTVRNLFFF